MPQRSDTEVDRLLAKGGPGGPVADALWDQISMRLPEPARTSRPETRAWLWWLLAPAVPALGVLAFMLLPGEGLQPRGPGSGPAAVVEHSCAQRGEACGVGQPIFLRLRVLKPGGVAYVTLGHGAQGSVLGGPFTLNPDSILPVPSKVTPEATDVGTQLHFRVLWFAAPPTPEELSTAVADASSRAMVSSLSVTVSP